jgi:hypothetical protein
MAIHTYNLTSLEDDLFDRVHAVGKQTNQIACVIIAMKIMTSRTCVTPQKLVLGAMQTLQAHKLRFLESQRVVFRFLLNSCVLDNKTVSAVSATDMHVSAVAEVIGCLSIDSYSLQHDKWYMNNSDQEHRVQRSCPLYMTITLFHVNVSNHFQYFSAIDVINGHDEAESLSASDDRIKSQCEQMTGLYNFFQKIDLQSTAQKSLIVANAAISRLTQKTINFVDFVAIPPPHVDMVEIVN